MERDDPIILTKLDAARRQLETAATLYFHERDQVSIHTLAAAAHEILLVVARSRKVESVVDRVLNVAPTPELKELLLREIRRPANYFKHASRDVGETLEFSPRITKLLLLDSVMLYTKLTGEVLLVLKAYFFWFAIQHPELMRFEEPIASVFRNARKDFPSRLEFLQTAIERDAQKAPSW